MGVAAKPRSVPAYPVVAYLPAEIGSWGGQGTTERPFWGGACIACVSGFATEVPVRGPGGTSCYSRLVFVTPLWASSLRQGLCLFRHFARHLCVDRVVVAGFGQMLSDGDCGSWKMNILEKWNVFLCRVIAAPVCYCAGQAKCPVLRCIFSAVHAVHDAELHPRLLRIFDKFPPVKDITE